MQGLEIARDTNNHIELYVCVYMYTYVLMLKFDRTTSQEKENGRKMSSDQLLFTSTCYMYIRVCTCMCV